MYQLFAQKVYDSEQLRQTLSKDDAAISATDITKATGREDALAYKLVLNPEKLGINLNTITDGDLADDEETFLANMKISDDYAKKLCESLNVNYSLIEVFSARYDYESEEIGIVCLVSIMYIETARKKQKDLMKRLFANIE